MDPLTALAMAAIRFMAAAAAVGAQEAQAQLWCAQALFQQDKGSRGIKRDKLNGTNRAEFAVFFADVCRFSLFLELQHFKGADFCRKPQETADSRRNPFVPFSLSLLIPPCAKESTLIRGVPKSEFSGSQRKGG